MAARTPKAEALRAETARRQMAAKLAWNPSDLPAWLTEKVYHERIQPKLVPLTVPAIARVLGVSKPYATDVRAGKRVPHPRHWMKLANLIGLH